MVRMERKQKIETVPLPGAGVTYQAAAPHSVPSDRPGLEHSHIDRVGGCCDRMRNDGRVRDVLGRTHSVTDGEQAIYGTVTVAVLWPCGVLRVGRIRERTPGRRTLGLQ